MRHLSNQQKTLLIRIFWFCGLFLVVSGFIGSWIIPTKLLYGFHFFIYGNMGKMVLIFAILLGLIARSRIAQLSHLPAPRTNIPALVTAALLIPTFFALATRLLEYGSFAQQPALSLLTHIVLVAIPALLGVGIFGARHIRSLAITYRREIGISLLVALLLDIMIFQVWKLWPIFSTGVLLSVKWLLSLTFERVTHIPPYLLAVDGFAVAIEQACSGLDSLFLFTALYVMVMIVDYKRLNIAKLIYTYIPAVLGMYVINILRVYVLMLIGILISPQIAIRLFHTYAGMVLFIVYFVLFWSVMYKRLLKKNE